MALAQREASFAERLRAQAAILQRRGLELVREGEDLKREALEMRNEADRLDRAPVTPRRPASVNRDADFAARVIALVSAGGMTKRQLCEHLNASAARVGAALERLEAAGAIYRSGRTAGTRYHVREAESPRAGSATLRVFTKTTPERELQDREVAWTTAAPAVVGELPERD